ncbi:MAG TPA: isoaspartyl peptidase/L-asparaginase [Pyrinomonadaceae bacterium]|nr:isoaspartyl peptidase/L-asparaginase [Pyrinomonadaceae bacterium]
MLTKNRGASLLIVSSILLLAVSSLLAQGAISNTPDSSGTPGVSSVSPAQGTRPKFMFVIHGGAGAIERSKMTPEMERDYRAKLTEALEAGHRVLSNNGSGLDAVEAAIRIMEDSPLFNAGKGAVFTSAGTNELDSSIMDGRNLAAGSVAGLKHVKNPISLARMVMEKSPHVMMVGEGAETFARQQGVQMVPQSYFHTERRWKDLQRIKEGEKQKTTTPTKKSARLGRVPPGEDGLRGTVGAVALDAAGNLAAGTSTGGMTNKRFGRVGDSPIIGAGTYADNQTCAVSATGDGEYFIRAAVAHEISALVGYKGMSVAEAADTVLDKVKRLGGTGGVIVLDKNGNFAAPFNTAGMYRGHIGPDGKAVVEIYRD